MRSSGTLANVQISQSLNSTYCPWLFLRLTQITSSMYYSNNINVLRINDPVDDPVTLKNHFPYVLTLSLCNPTTTLGKIG